MARTCAILTMTAALLATAPAALAGEAAVAITTGAAPQLVRFETTKPATPTARMPVVGLLFGETVEAIDQRIANGELLAVTSLNRMLVIDPATGFATPAGNPLAAGFVAPPGLGSDVNPTVDRLRLTSTAGRNGRWNPIVRIPVDADANAANGDTPDTDLAFAAGDPHGGLPTVVDIAYAANDTDGATPTTAYALEANSDILTRLGGPNGTPSPNLGQLTTIGALGVPFDDGSLDIATGPTGVDTAYASLHATADASSRLYRVNLATGAATLLGTIGGARVDAMAILRGGAIRVAPATVAEHGTASIAVTRTGDSLGPAQVGYRTVGGTATPGSDYTDVAGTLSFASGQRTASIAVPITADALDEPAETFSLTFGAPTGGAVVDTPSTPIAITGDDAKPVFLAAPTPPDTLRALRSKGSLKLQYACSEACVASFALKLGSKTVGTALASRPSAGLGTATVRLSTAGKKTVASAARKRGTTTLTLAATVHDLAGNTVTSTTRMKVRRR